MRMWILVMGIVVGGSLISSMGNPASAAQTETDSRSGVDATGRMLFSKHCAGCHGPEGRGDGYMMLGTDPANLTRPLITHKSDAILLQTIHEGKPNMPSWKLRLSEADSRAVLAYIRTLSR